MAARYKAPMVTTSFLQLMLQARTSWITRSKVMMQQPARSVSGYAFPHFHIPAIRFSISNTETVQSQPAKRTNQAFGVMDTLEYGICRVMEPCRQQTQQRRI